MNEQEMQVRLAYWFGITKYVIVPNVSYGFLPYEADLLILTKTGYVWEVEIKVSIQDLIKDKKKLHSHNSRRVRQVWFAIPEAIKDGVEHIPDYAGILIVGDGISELRTPKINPLHHKLSLDEQFKLARLGAIRVWPMMNRIIKK